MFLCEEFRSLRVHVGALEPLGVFTLRILQLLPQTCDLTCVFRGSRRVCVTVALISLGEATFEVSDALLPKLNDHFVTGSVLFRGLQRSLLFLVGLGQCFYLLLILFLLNIHVFEVLSQQLLNFANTIFHLLQLCSPLLVHLERLRILLLKPLHADS